MEFFFWQARLCVVKHVVGKSQLEKMVFLSSISSISIYFHPDFFQGVHLSFKPTYAKSL